MKRLYIFSVKLTASDGTTELETATVIAGRTPREAFKTLTTQLDLNYPTYDHTIKLEETR